MVQNLRFDGQTVVVTGAGAGLGKAYALFFASRGANVVVNDLGGDIKGLGASRKAADIVVEEIKANGGNAVANHNSVVDGEKIVQTAIDTFGRIDVLINNAGILRDISFKNMTDADWDIITAVHLAGTYNTTSAAWPYFVKQKYGRIINTTSVAGLYGNFGQTNYASAKLGLVGYTEALANAGAAYNIYSNVIAPQAGSRLTATVLPPEIIALMKPEYVTPLVAVLVHPSGKENGSIFEVGAGHMAKVRWQRAAGLFLKPDHTYTPSAVLRGWSHVNNFSTPEYSRIPPEPRFILSQVPKPDEQCPEVRFDNKVVVITRAGTGLGRESAVAYAKLGAKVVVNDPTRSEDVVKQIKAAGGQAVANIAPAGDGDAIVKTALDTWGRIDILINNLAATMSGSTPWQRVIDSHLRDTYKMSKAAWPHMVKQKYGRIINVAGVPDGDDLVSRLTFATANAGIIGFSQALALEGRKSNVFVNAIESFTWTKSTSGGQQNFYPAHVSALVLLLSSDKIPDLPTGLSFQAGSAWQARLRWQRAGGHLFPLKAAFTPEDVAKHWRSITNFDDGRADYPRTIQDSGANVFANLNNPASKSLPTKFEGSKYLDTIENAKKEDLLPLPFTWTWRDTILYNLSLNAKRTQLPLVFEKDPNFQVLPTYGVIPMYGAPTKTRLDNLIPNFSTTRILHGEHYLEIRKFPIPTEAKVASYARLLEVVDKGSASIVIQEYETKDVDTGEVLFYNISTLFVRGSGGFNGVKNDINRGAASVNYKPPDRAPDAVVEEKTSDDQAALYRLNGDHLPLHIDPVFAKQGGFDHPILHGLCTFGFAGKHIFLTYGEFKNIKVRFSGVVFPGQTLVTEMWRDGDRVTFQTKVKETGKLALASSGAELRKTPKQNL